MGFAQIVPRSAQGAGTPLPEAPHLTPPATRRPTDPATWHVLFDLDGTLTDPGPGIIGCITHALTTLRRPVPPEARLRSYIGPPLQATFAMLLGETSEDSPLTCRAIALYRERFVARGMYENAPYPGIPELLIRLHEVGCRLYVATSKPTVFATEIVRHFGIGHYFTAVHGSELSGERSEKAELLTHLLEQEDIAPETAVMIGDREHDVLGAIACALRISIGVTYGYGSADELRAAGADALCDSPEEVGEALRRLMQ